jgi:hypothetical protein
VLRHRVGRRWSTTSPSPRPAIVIAPPRAAANAGVTPIKAVPRCFDKEHELGRADTYRTTRHPVDKRSRRQAGGQPMRVRFALSPQRSGVLALTRGQDRVSVTIGFTSAEGSRRSKRSCRRSSPTIAIRASSAAKLQTSRHRDVAKAQVGAGPSPRSKRSSARTTAARRKEPRRAARRCCCLTPRPAVAGRPDGGCFARIAEDRRARRRASPIRPDRERGRC